MRAAPRVILCAVVVPAILAACATEPPEGSAPPVPLTPAVSDALASATDLPLPPESYGLVPVEQLRADPGPVAAALTGRLGQSAWTTVWRTQVAGEEGGQMTVEFLPPEGDRAGRLHMQGAFSAADAKSIEVHLLDDGSGSGPRACMREKQQAYVCDKKDFVSVLQFLSIDGLTQLSAVVQEAVRRPGAAVQYRMIAGEPATCFVLPPQAMSTETLGVDFENGGVVCLSRIGAILKLETGTLSVDAVEYRTSADPGNFRLPV